MKNSLDKAKETKVLIAQTRAFCNTVHDILFNDTAEEIARYSAYKAMARFYECLVEKTKKLLETETIIATFDTSKMPSPSQLGWHEQKQLLDQIYLSGQMLLASLEGDIDFADDEFENFENFLQSRLRSAVFQQPEKEIEVQNIIESLFIGRGMAKGVDYERESGKFEFSGKEYIPDFVIKKMSLCIEVKLLRPGKRSRIIEEISADITAYKKMYPRQLYVVYDLGVIQNEAEFKRDIELIDGVKVVVVKH